MKHAKYVTINNLDIISEFLYNKFLTYNNKAPILFKNDFVQSSFFDKSIFDNNIIKEEFQRLQIYNHWIGTEVFIFQPGYSPPHSDGSDIMKVGVWKYSLNIPVQPVDEFYVKFYSSNDLPEQKNSPEGPGRYWDYSNCTLNLEQTLSANTPYIINTFSPHDMDNRSTLKTYTFAFRLSRNLEINIT